MAERGDGAALTLGTAGHIDHGKTTLVAALTGIDTDRLAEEKRRGISLELGFAELELPGGGRLGIVDVPGHERLVRTMVAGASGIDLFLLVVAADDGVMPQTREHLEALRALGVERGVVALSKCDLVDDEARRLAAIEVGELVGGAPIVPVSGRTGEGLERLRDELARVGSQAAAGPSLPAWPDPPGLLHADRVFTLRGIGTVVTGTVAAGSFYRGQRARLLPRNVAARIRSIQSHGRELESVGRGRRAALNLAGIDRDAVARGDALVAGDGPTPAYRLDVELTGAAAERPPFGRRVQLHHGTRDVPARVVELGTGTLAQLRLEAPAIARPGDRAVLRRISPPGTLGGAIILDPAPRRHGPGAEVERLLALRDGEPERIVELAVRGRAEGLPIDPVAWLEDPLVAFAVRRFPPPRWRQAIERLAADRRIAIEDGRLVDPNRPAGPPRRAAAPLGRRPRRALALLARDGIEPRSPGALAEALGVERHESVAALGDLVAAGQAVRIAPDVYYPAEQLARIERIGAELARRRGSITIAELRDSLHTSRKYAQAILEHLDRIGATSREGDRHLPRERPPGQGPTPGAAPRSS